MDHICLKGLDLYGGITRLHTHSKLSLDKILSNLVTKTSFTKYCSIRLKFLRLSFVIEINENWSLNKANIDKLAKYNRNTNYRLVADDCLSKNLQVELLKTKFATEAAEEFKKMIKNSPKKYWLTMVQNFLEHSINCATTVECIFIVLSTKK